LKSEARAELARIEKLGGAMQAIEEMKRSLVESNTARLKRIESGEQIVVGVNKWTETEPSPLSTGEGAILTVPKAVEREQIAALKAWRAARDGEAVERALAALAAAARNGTNIMAPSIACAKAGVTTGEWGATLRRAFGEYRAPTGVPASSSIGRGKELDGIRARVEKASHRLGRRLKILIGKPGLDGHSNGAEQIAVRARDCGMEVVYEGIRLTPRQIVTAAIDEDVHVIGLSILSGSHVPLVRDVMTLLGKEGSNDVPVVVGGIIPAEDGMTLKSYGVAAVYTPKNFDLNAIMSEIVSLVEKSG
jgi:(2R)-ethylmalonyl-CoA mutase